MRMLDYIRQKCMVRLYKRYAKACTWEGELTLMATKKLHEIVKESRKFSILPRNNDEFEVMDGRLIYAVSLERKNAAVSYGQLLEFHINMQLCVLVTRKEEFMIKVPVALSLKQTYRSILN